MKRNLGFQSESDMAAVLVKWLRAEGHEVWQEVRVPIAYDMTSCDVMTMRGPAVHAIQCKLSMSLSLLDQALEWLRYANYVSVAVPAGSAHRYGNAVRDLLHRHGIGVFSVHYLTESEQKEGYREVEIETQPKLHRFGPLVEKHGDWMDYIAKMRAMLKAIPQDYGVAGAKHTSRYSPFRATCDAVIDFVTKHPGCTFKEMMTDLDHHYSSDATAKCCIRKWAGSPSLPVRFERDGRMLRMYVNPSPAPRV